MKTMTCKQLGGACDLEFTAESFEEMAKLSRAHAMDMLKNSDGPHLEAMDKMKHLMKSPSKMEQWFLDKKQEFESTPENKA